MDCNNASDLVMKFMDGIISNKEEKSLRTHLDLCKVCKEEFAVYEQMMKDFTKIELISAPESFELDVMEKIGKLETLDVKRKDTVDNLLYILWTTFSILIGIGFIIAINKDAIITYMQANEYLRIYAELLAPVSAYANEFITNFTAVFSTFVTSAFDILSSLKYVLLGLAVIMGITQYIIYKRNKVEA